MNIPGRQTMGSEMRQMLEGSNNRIITEEWRRRKRRRRGWIKRREIILST